MKTMTSNIEWSSTPWLSTVPPTVNVKPFLVQVGKQELRRGIQACTSIMSIQAEVLATCIDVLTTTGFSVRR